ncbi:hypothetical protein [Pseudomonas aeruginosa]|uniref:hypothetical protein n=1 Tax=Pseudomonas aeruginosa TaxID=287 RepID=UPI00359F6464
MFPSDKTTKIRNEIVNFHQFGGESFAKYFERFKELLIIVHITMLRNGTFVKLYITG